jgi:hypothetical protein
MLIVSPTHIAAEDYNALATRNPFREMPLFFRGH